MFRRTHKTTTEHRQLIDDTTEDEIIETKIKECQRENDYLKIQMVLVAVQQLIHL